MYARHKGGRLPSEPELRLFLDTYGIQFRKHIFPQLAAGDQIEI